MKNTKDSGTFKIFFYPTKHDGWCGVCPDFGIVDYYGEFATREELTQFKIIMKEACEMYLESVFENNASDDLLNKQVHMAHTLRFLWFRFIKSTAQETDRDFQRTATGISFA